MLLARSADCLWFCKIIVSDSQEGILKRVFVHVINFLRHTSCVMNPISDLNCLSDSCDASIQRTAQIKFLFHFLRLIHDMFCSTRLIFLGFYEGLFSRSANGHRDIELPSESNGLNKGREALALCDRRRVLRRSHGDGVVYLARGLQDEGCAAHPKRLLRTTKLSNQGDIPTDQKLCTTEEGQRGLEISPTSIM